MLSINKHTRHWLMASFQEKQENKHKLCPCQPAKLQAEISQGACYTKKLPRL